MANSRNRTRSSSAWGGKVLRCGGICDNVVIQRVASVKSPNWVGGDVSNGIHKETGRKEYFLRSFTCIVSYYLLFHLCIKA